MNDSPENHHDEGSFDVLMVGEPLNERIPARVAIEPRERRYKAFINAGGRSRVVKVSRVRHSSTIAASAGYSIKRWRWEDK